MVAAAAAALQPGRPGGQPRRGGLPFLSKRIRDGQLLEAKIKVSGRLSGKGCPREVVPCLLVLACARVLAGQLIYLQLRNRRTIHGKEKVYGSIP